VSIITKQLDNVVEVPTAAITYATSGQAEVTEVKDGKHVTQSVTVGEAAAGETQITSGLASGDSIVERVFKFSGTGGRTGTTGLGGGFTRTGGGGFGEGGGGFTRTGTGGAGGGGAGFGGAGG
jgi:hypothetical protein